MSEQVETLRIKATDPEQGEYIIINASDFDADKHVLFDDSDDTAPTKRGRKASGSDAEA